MSVSQALPNFTDILFANLPRFTDTAPPESEGKQDSSVYDTMPWRAANQYGQNAKGSYYYLNEPSERQLYKTARYTAFGWRIVYDTSADMWNNDFELDFLDTIPEDNVEKNKQLTKHFNSILFYQEAMKATAFDREQGESLLHAHREGDDYKKLFEAPDYSKRILRCEAINKIDYSIPRIEEFGIPNYYRIAFWRAGMGKPTYNVHTKRAVRFKAHNLEYDLYTGNGVLKPIFADLNIILMVTQAVGDAAFRWAIGMPAIMTQGVSDKDLPAFKQIIGNPTSQTWLLLPSERIKEIKMLGTSGTMLNLKELIDVPINNIVAATGIPRPILLGEVSGVQTGSEVNERTYFAYLDQQQRAIETFIREFILMDPEAMEIVGDLEYKINWGLRQVMTKQAEALLRQNLIANGVALAAIGTFNECRLEAEMSVFEEAIDKDLCMDLYGYSPEDMGSLPMTTAQALMVLAVNAGSDEDNEDNPEVPEDEDGEEVDEPNPATEQENKQPEKPVNDGALLAKQQLNDSLCNFRTIIGSVNKMVPELGISKGSINRLINALKA